LERVEVLRGPQGTLNGRNATAGSISLFTKLPADTFGVAQKFSYGTFNDFLSRTTIDTGEIGSTGLTARLVYMKHRVDGYYNNTLEPRSQDPGAENTDAAFFALHGSWGNLTLDNKFDYNDSKFIGPPAQVVTANATWLSFFQTYNPGFTINPHFNATYTGYNPRPGVNTGLGDSLILTYDVS
jgi:iron complex outermembrane receptor protein